MMERAGSPTTPIFDRYASQSSFIDDQDDPSSASLPLQPTNTSYHHHSNSPYLRPPPMSPASPQPAGGARRHPLANLLTPASSTPTLATDADADSTYDAKRASNVHVAAAGSSTPYLANTPESEEKHFSLPNGQSSNSASGGLLAWLAEDEKRRSSEANHGGPSRGAAAISGEEGRRVGYLDGLKFLAGLVAMNGAFLAITQEEPGAVERSSPLYVARSVNIALQALLLLSGRSLPIPLPHASPLLSLSLLSRPLRFVPPVIVVILLQWGLCTGGHITAFNTILGLAEPQWCGIRNAAGFFTLLWGLFSNLSYNTAVGQAFGAMLWSVPWFFQGSYFTYLLHIVVSALPSNRYWLYIVLFCFTWATYSYFTPTLLGYIIYDMSTVFLPRVRRMPLVQRLLVQAILLGLIVLFEFIGPTRDAIDSGMAAWNVRAVTQIAFGDTFFVTFLLLWVEITPWAQLVLGNILVRYLFILTPGLYLLTPSLTYTVVPAVLSHFSNPLHNAGGLFAAWAALLVTTCLLSLVFYFTVIYPSVYLSRVLCSFLASWGPDADPDSFADGGIPPQSAAADGKHRRIYVEKPFRSFSLVTSAFGTPIGSPAPSVRRMRMGGPADDRASQLSQAHPDRSSRDRPLSPRIEMTPLSSPEGLTPHGSTEELSAWNNHPPPPQQMTHSRTASAESQHQGNGKGRRESWQPEQGTGYARGWQNRMDSPAERYSSGGGGGAAQMRQVGAQSPPPLFHVPPPAPPRGAARPMSQQQQQPYYGGAAM